MEFTSNNGILVAIDGVKANYPLLYPVKQGNGYIFYNKDKPLFSCTSFTVDGNPGTIQLFCSTFFKEDNSKAEKELQQIYTAYDTYVSTKLYPSGNDSDNVCSGLQHTAADFNDAIKRKGVTPASIKMEDAVDAIYQIQTFVIGEPTVLMNIYIDNASQFTVSGRPENGFNDVTFFNTSGQFQQGGQTPYGWNYKVFNNCKVEGDVAASLFSDDYWSKIHYINDIFTNCTLSIWSILQPKFTVLTDAKNLFDGIVFDGKDYDITFDSQATIDTIGLQNFCNLYPVAANSGSVSIRFPRPIIKEDTSVGSAYVNFGSYVKYIYGAINTNDRIPVYYLGCGPNHLPSASDVKNYGNFVGWKNLDGTWYGLNDLFATNINTTDENLFIGGKKVSQEWIAAIADGLKARLGSCTITLDSEVLAAIPADVQAKFTAKNYVLKGV